MIYKLSALMMIFVVSAMVSSADAAPATWRLVYSVDRDGETRGDKARLMNAVRAGQPIRVGWGVSFNLPDGTDSGVEHVANAKFLTIFDGEVFAQVDAIARQRPRPGQKRIVLPATGMSVPWVAIFDTTGHMRTPETSDESDTRMRSFWYIRAETGNESDFLPIPGSLR